MNKLNYTPMEARAALGISSSEIFRLLESGEIPAYKISRNWKIPVKALIEWNDDRGKKEAKERKEKN